jgi:hypothetical protein
MNKKKPTYAWHFVSDTLRDGTPIPKDDVWLEHKGPVRICESGLHASRNPFDALQYAPGATLCLVEVEGIECEQDDKLVCRRRKIVARMDATALMRYFARMQAVSAIDRWDAPDVVCDYLMTGDESLRDAARDATRDATRDAARVAAWDAAWDAARDAAWDAARDAARDATKNEFTQLVCECFEDFIFGAQS